MPYIPLELIEAIIEQLADSPPALRACALVCHAWLPAAYSALFCKFHFRMRTATSDGISELRAGLMFPHYVSCLIISNGFCRSAMPPTFADTLSLFNHTTKIHLAHYEPGPLTSLSILHKTHKYLRELEITSFPFANARSLQAFIAAFPHLEHLSMFYLISSTQNEDRDTDGWYPPPPPHLSNVAYKSADSYRAPFLRWLSSHQPTINHLTLPYLAPNEFEAATILFHALGPHLRTLDLSYGDTPLPLSQVPDCLSLHTNTHLHTLRTSCTPPSLHNPSPSLHILSNLLSSKSPALCCIIIEIIDKDVTFENLEWDDLDAILARQAPALECLHVCVADEPLHKPSPSMCMVLGAKMPWCLRRGALRGMDVMIDCGRLVHERLPPVPASEL